MVMSFSKKNKLLTGKILFSIILILMVSAAFAYSSYIGIYLLYLCPIAIFFVILQAYSEVRHPQLGEYVFYIIPIISASLFIPIFFIVYFCLYYPIFSQSVSKIEGCQVIGIAPAIVQNEEHYSILYVDFKYNGQTMLGYACMSDQTRDTYHNQFLYYGEQFECQSEYCTYTFSQKKLPSWMCLDRGISFEKLVLPQTCYISFYQDHTIAYTNSYERQNLKNIKNFAIAQFEYPTYYPKTGYIFFILLTYVPILCTFYPFISLLFEQIQEAIDKEKESLTQFFD